MYHAERSPISNEPVCFLGLQSGRNTVYVVDAEPGRAADLFAHETGHVLSEQRRYRYGTVLGPNEVADATLPIDKRACRKMADALSYDPRTAYPGHAFIKRWIDQALIVFTRGRYDPSMIHAFLGLTDEEMEALTRGTAISGYRKDPNGVFVPAPDPKSIASEVGAVYTAESCCRIISNTLAMHNYAVALPKPHPLVKGSAEELATTIVYDAFSSRRDNPKGLFA